MLMAVAGSNPIDFFFAREENLPAGLPDLDDGSTGPGSIILGIFLGTRQSVTIHTNGWLFLT